MEQKKQKTQEYYKQYYIDNRNKFYDYQDNTPRVFCSTCNRTYKFNDFKRHINTSMHKNRVLKKKRERI